MDLQKLIERARNILLKPKEEWPVIEAESVTARTLYRDWIVVLAAVTPVAGFIGLMLFGLRVPFVGTVRVGFLVGLAQMMLGYLMALGMAYAVALLVDGLAPTFGGERSRIQALKTVAFGWTAAWLSGVFGLVPGLWALGLLGMLYSIYLLYLGLPVTMKVPEERAGGYTATVVVAAIVLSVALGAVVNVASGLNAFSREVIKGASSGAGKPEDVASVDPESALGRFARTGEKVEEAGKKMQAAEKAGDRQAQAKAAQEVVGAILGGGDKVESLPPDLLKPFLPETLGGLQRASLSAEKNSVFGVQVSKGEAVYRDEYGAHEIRLEVTDTGGAKGVVGFAGVASAERDSEAEWGYERLRREGGRLVHEKWYRDTKHGEYGLLLAGRFAVKLDCDGYEMDEIKRIAATLDLAGLEALRDRGVTKG